MNARFLLVLLAGLMPCVQAESREPIASTTISCQSPHWPTGQQVAGYLQAPKVVVGEINKQAQGPVATVAAIPDPTQVQRAERVAHYIRRQGRRECFTGIYHVRVDFYAQPDRSVAVRMQPR